MADDIRPTQLKVIKDPNDIEDAGNLNPFQHQSILVEETKSMENARRKLEQSGHRKHGRVNSTERPDYEVSHDNELAAQAGPKEHPFLSTSQRFDGIDPSLNPAPDLGTEARREFDNEKRNQEQEKQHRLGAMPTNTRKNTPEFKP